MPAFGETTGKPHPGQGADNPGGIGTRHPPEQADWRLGGHTAGYLILPRGCRWVCARPEQVLDESLPAQPGCIPQQGHLWLPAVSTTCALVSSAHSKSRRCLATRI
eukprot:scaffold8026_cov34-Prasinocladus_malaysianus.AAC.1